MESDSNRPVTRGMDFLTAGLVSEEQVVRPTWLDCQSIKYGNAQVLELAANAGSVRYYHHDHVYPGSIGPWGPLGHIPRLQVSQASRAGNLVKMEILILQVWGWGGERRELRCSISNRLPCDANGTDLVLPRGVFSFLLSLCSLPYGGQPSVRRLPGLYRKLFPDNSLSWDRPRLDIWLRPFPLSIHGGCIHLGMRRGS